MTQRDLVLVVNVNSRWPEVLRGSATVEEVVLGDWNLADRKIDPYRVACVIASYRNRNVAAFAVYGPQFVPGTARPRVRFHTDHRIRHFEGQRSPYTWRRGELYPVAALLLDELPDLDDTKEERVELAGYVLCVHPDGDATVIVPSGHTLSVQSGPAAPTTP